MKIGDLLAEGHYAEAGKGGELGLLLSNGTLLSLEPGTRIRIGLFGQQPFESVKSKLSDLPEEPSLSQVEIDLNFGALVVKTKKLRPSSSFLIRSSSDFLVRKAPNFNFLRILLPTCSSTSLSPPFPSPLRAGNRLPSPKAKDWMFPRSVPSLPGPSTRWSPKMFPSKINPQFRHHPRFPRSNVRRHIPAIAGFLQPVCHCFGRPRRACRPGRFLFFPIRSFFSRRFPHLLRSSTESSNKIPTPKRPASPETLGISLPALPVST